ncbi:MAG: MopE-related protein [Sandaracinaceae bacterium]
MRQPSTQGLALLSGACVRSSLTMLATLVCLAGCASGSVDDAGTVGDTGPRRDSGGGRTDSGADEDAGQRDAGAPCGGVACEAFQYCDSGMCRDYPACRGDGTCDRPTDVCHNRHCVPGDVDIDGDGSPASMDCDETNPEVYPGQDEECNGIDDDCDMMIDDGDPAALCESYPGGGICAMGNCGCPAGTFDLDRTIAGCECVAMPAIDQGLECASAIALGDFSDTGSMMTVTGNVMPDDREVWYSFRAVDNADTSCDNFYVRVLLVTNPSDTFEFTVFRGDCSASAECSGGGAGGGDGFDDFSWASDFRATVGGRLAGQCPCYAPGATMTSNVSECQDDTAQYFVRVRRRQGSTLNCAQYSLEISNGIYDTP